jgi:predicted extracellular nuclease
VAFVPAVVTARSSSGFYMQDPSPDGDPATSEALFVFTSSAPGVQVGDSVLVSGTVAEFRPGGGGGSANLSTTELTSPS